MEQPRVTELPNPFTLDIDVAGPAAMMRLLGASDSLMFSGYGGLPHLYSDECVGAMCSAAQAVAIALYHPKGRVVFSGCGTSGRLSHMISRAFNAWMSRQFPGAEPRFDYLLAGGDSALLLPQESVEDKPDAGVIDLERWEAENGVAPTDPIVVIGISCGLSATYVGSMLSTALTRPGYTPVALGFNPVEAVRDVRVDGWKGSFYATLQAMLRGPAAGRCVVINPVLGPETIAGSSRMKGGSATKMVLDTVCTAGVLISRGVLAPCVAAAAAATYAGASSAPSSPPSDSSSSDSAPAAPPPAATSSGSAAAAPDAPTAASLDDATALLPALVRDALLQYELGVRALYNSCSREVSQLVSLASSSLTTPVPGPLLAPPPEPAAFEGGARRFVSPTGLGRVVYLGIGAAGLLGLVDASECTPTYGSCFNDVRGFIAGGWDAVQAKEVSRAGGQQLALPMPPHLRGDRGASGSAAIPEQIYLGLDAFSSDFLPTLCPADTVVLVWVEEAAAAGPSGSDPLSPDMNEALGALSAARDSGAAVAHVLVAPWPTPRPNAPSTSAFISRVKAVAPVGVLCRLPSVQVGWDLRGSAPPQVSAPLQSAMAPAVTLLPSFAGELALKLVLNAITTGAHIARGTIYRNRMVNVAITNQKLFHRAVRIVADVTSAPTPLAQRCIVRAIYGLDGEESRSAARDLVTLCDATAASEHVAAACTQQQLVPAAILLALDAMRRPKGEPAMRVAAAAATLEAEPVIRKALLLAAGTGSGGR